MILRDLVDAEQRHRAPREGDGLGHALLHHVAHLRSRSACTLVPPSSVTQAATVACDGRTFMPLMSPGTTIFFLLECHVQRIEDEGEAVLHVLHLVRRVFAIPGVDRADAALGVADQERQLAGGDDREAAGLVAGIDVGEVGDAVARHVVMVERLAELLGREDLELDGAVRCLLDRRAPFLHRLLQRMRRRHPVRKLEIEGLVLRERGGRADQQAGDRRGACCKMTLASMRWHRFLLVGIGR